MDENLILPILRRTKKQPSPTCFRLTLKQEDPGIGLCRKSSTPFFIFCPRAAYGASCLMTFRNLFSARGSI